MIGNNIKSPRVELAHCILDLRVVMRISTCCVILFLCALEGVATIEFEGRSVDIGNELYGYGQDPRIWGTNLV